MGICCGVAQSDPPTKKRIRDTQAPLLSNPDRKTESNINAKIELEDTSFSNNSYSASISTNKKIKQDIDIDNNQTDILSKHNTSLSTSKRAKASLTTNEETYEIQVISQPISNSTSASKMYQRTEYTSIYTSNKKQSKTNAYSIMTDINNNSTQIALETDEKEFKSKQESNESKVQQSSYLDLPQTISEMPIESTLEMDEIDLEFYHQLQERYAAQLIKCKVDEYFLRRFIFGFNNIPKKQRMQSMTEVIDEYFVFHEKYDINNIAKSRSTKEEYDVWPHFIYGEDKAGHPIIYDMIASADPKLVAKKFGDNGTSDPVFHILCTLRKMANYENQNSVKYGCIIHKHIQVFDAKNVGMGHLAGDARKTSQRVIGMLSDFYPETAHTLYVINSPKMFRVIWKVVSKFMDPVTVAKTKILGKKYLQEMLKEIDISMIPEMFGGTGKWEIQMGDVPKDYPIDILHGID